MAPLFRREIKQFLKSCLPGICIHSPSYVNIAERFYYGYKWMHNYIIYGNRKKTALMLYEGNEDSYSPTHAHNLIRNFSVNYMASRKHTYIILTPLNPHSYIVKLGFTEVYIIFLISALKHRLWVLVRTASARRF